jgi:hypothetical protein
VVDGEVVLAGACPRAKRSSSGRPVERESPDGTDTIPAAATAKMHFDVVSVRPSARTSAARCKDAVVELDTDIASNRDAVKPAELRLAALSACMVKGIVPDLLARNSSCAASRCGGTACATTCRRNGKDPLRDRRRHRRGRPPPATAARQLGPGRGTVFDKGSTPRES